MWAMRTYARQWKASGSRLFHSVAQPHGVGSAVPPSTQLGLPDFVPRIRDGSGKERHYFHC